MARLLVALAFGVPLAAASPSIETAEVRLDDILPILGSFRAVEVQLPGTVRSLYIGYARASEFVPLGSIEFHERFPERVRVVTGFPVALGGQCEAPTSSVWIYASTEDGGLHGSNCIRIGDGSGGGWYSPVSERDVTLDRWIPLQTYRPNPPPDGSRSGLRRAGAEEWLIVLLYVSTASSGRDEPPVPNLREIQLQLNRLP